MSAPPTSNSSLKAIPHNQVYVTSNFWKNRIRITKYNTLPAIWRQLKESGRWDVLRLNWREGMPNRPHHFWDSDIAKWTEAACYALMPPAKSLEGSVTDTLTNDNEIYSFLTSKVTEAVDMISEAQWKDGYINSYFTVVEPGKRWSNVAWNHEMYCAGHLLEAAIAHHDYVKATVGVNTTDNGGDDEVALLRPLIKYVKHIKEIFGSKESQRRGYPGHQELELALMKLHDHLSQTSLNVFGPDTATEALSLASFFIHERGTIRNGMHFYDYEAKLRKNDPPASPGPSYPDAPRWIYNQAHAPIKDIQTVEGHSVRAGYWLTGASHVARVTKDDLLVESVKRLWYNMTERKMYITGGIGAIGDWEGFGPDYYFPNETAYLETCAAISLIFFAHQMHFLNPFEVKYYDIRVLYNGALVGLSLDGKKFFYDNPLATVGKEVRRKDWYEVACCPPNIARLLASMGKYIYSYGPLSFDNHPKECLFINLLIPSKAVFRTRSGGEIFIEQEQVDNHFTFCVTGRQSIQDLVTIYVRIPNWTSPEDVDFNCRDCIHSTLSSGIATFEILGPLPTVDISMIVRPRLIYPDPNDHVNRGCVALGYGPHVYCVETVDNPDITDLRHIRIPRDVESKFVKRHKEVEGITLECLSCRAYIDNRVLTEEEENDWVVVPRLGELLPVEITFIPYFAWANRGASDLRVWHQLVDAYEEF